MKKYALLALVIVFVGCQPSTNTKTTDLKTLDYKITVDGYATSHKMRKFEFEGHKYLLLDGFHTTGIEHDPNCPCFRVDK